MNPLNLSFGSFVKIVIFLDLEIKSMRIKTLRSYNHCVIFTFYQQENQMIKMINTHRSKNTRSSWTGPANPNLSTSLELL